VLEPLADLPKSDVEDVEEAEDAQSLGKVLKMLLPVERKFELGRIVATPAIADLLSSREVTNALARHARGDWGDVSPVDWMDNETSLQDGHRLMSVYHAEDETPFWVVTEADRSVTTILLPEEY